MSEAIARKIESIRTKGALKNSDIANVLAIRPETVSRWNQGRSYPSANIERTLLELEFMIDQLSNFYEPEEARLWLFSPQKLLDGNSPANLINQGEIDKVRTVVNQMRDGVFV